MEGEPNIASVADLKESALNLKRYEVEKMGLKDLIEHEVLGNMHALLADIAKSRRFCRELLQTLEVFKGAKSGCDRINKDMERMTGLVEEARNLMEGSHRIFVVNNEKKLKGRIESSVWKLEEARKARKVFLNSEGLERRSQFARKVSSSGPSAARKRNACMKPKLEWSVLACVSVVGAAVLTTVVYHVLEAKRQSPM